MEAYLLKKGKLMKRYFFIPEKNMVFDVIINEKALTLTLADLEATTNLVGLKEITKEEYNRLEKI